MMRDVLENRMKRKAIAIYQKPPVLRMLAISQIKVKIKAIYLSLTYQKHQFIPILIITIKVKLRTLSHPLPLY